MLWIFMKSNLSHICTLITIIIIIINSILSGTKSITEANHNQKMTTGKRKKKRYSTLFLRIYKILILSCFIGKSVF